MSTSVSVLLLSPSSLYSLLPVLSFLVILVLGGRPSGRAIRHWQADEIIDPESDKGKMGDLHLLLGIRECEQGNDKTHQQCHGMEILERGTDVNERV